MDRTDGTTHGERHSERLDCGLWYLNFRKFIVLLVYWQSAMKTISCIIIADAIAVVVSSWEDRENKEEEKMISFRKGLRWVRNIAGQSVDTVTSCILKLFNLFRLENISFQCRLLMTCDKSNNKSVVTSLFFLLWFLLLFISQQINRICFQDFVFRQ